MSRKKSKRPTSRKTQEKSKNPTPKPIPISKSKPVKAIVGGICTFIAFLTAFVTLLPRLDVSIANPVAANDPFSSQVTITNSGYMPLNDVSVAIGVGEISTKQETADSVHPLTTNWASQLRGDWPKEDLSAGKKLTVPINDVVTTSSNNVTYAEIGIIVHYHWPLIPVEGEFVSRYIAKKQTNGQYYWNAHA